MTTNPFVALILLALLARKDEGDAPPPPPGTIPPTRIPPTEPPPPIVIKPPPTPQDPDPPPIIVDPPPADDPSDPPPIVIKPPPTPQDPDPPPIVVRPPPVPQPIPPHIPPSDGAHPTIRLGSTGEAVRRWQGLVGVAIDGKFGPNTHAATVAWQKARPPLVADGIVGPKTWERAELELGKITLPPPLPPNIPPKDAGGHPTIQQGSTGADVKKWQAILGIPADGIFGPNTKAATIAWQKKRPPLVADGIVGPKTWERAALDPVIVIPKGDAAPVPWPERLPDDLPPFPTGWIYDQPPPAAVQSRAKSLLPELWAKGSGSRKVEKTAGRWITYRAELTGPQKAKGVVAYRLKAA